MQCSVDWSHADISAGSRDIGSFEDLLVQIRTKCVTSLYKVLSANGTLALLPRKGGSHSADSRPSRARIFISSFTILSHIRRCYARRVIIQRLRIEHSASKATPEAFFASGALFLCSITAQFFRTAWYPNPRSSPARYHSGTHTNSLEPEYSQWT